MTISQLLYGCLWGIAGWLVLIDAVLVTRALL